MHTPIARDFIRFLLVISMLGIAVISVSAGQAFFESFSNTSYRIVALFLLAILASNILAKLARAYLDA